MNKLYPLQLWLTTIVVVAPVLIFFGSMIFDPSFLRDPNSLGVILLFIAFGLGYSLPTFLVSIIVFDIIARRIKSPLVIKMLLNFVSILGAFATFLIIGGSGAISGGLIYSTGIIISSLLFRVYKKNGSSSEFLEETGKNS